MSYAADVGYSFTNLLGNVIGIFVRVAIFLIIMALGWIIARWIRRALAVALHRVGFDRAAERGGLDVVLGRYSASDVAAQIVMYAFLIVVLYLAFGVFGQNAVRNLIGGVIAWLPRLFVAVVIVVVAAAVGGWVKQIISESLGGLSYGRVLGRATQVLVLILGIFAALTQIGVANTVITPVLWAMLFAITGIVVVGVGGGLIKPMQHRWERMLNRAETESTIAAERMRANQAARAAERDRNLVGTFGQPAYAGTMTGDEKAPTTPAGAQTPSGYMDDTEYPEEQYAEGTDRTEYDR